MLARLVFVSNKRLLTTALGIAAAAALIRFHMENNYKWSVDDLWPRFVHLSNERRRAAHEETAN